jgi:hypothetical protein
MLLLDHFKNVQSSPGASVTSPGSVRGFLVLVTWPIVGGGFKRQHLTQLLTQKPTLFVFVHLGGRTGTDDDT